VTLRKKIQLLAQSQIGVEEVGTSNCGVMVNAYKSATWLDSTHPFPWCAAFVCWLFREAMEGGEFTFIRPKTASAWDFERWCKLQDRSVVLRKPWSGVALPGDVVIYNFSHIGIIDSISPDKQTIFAIEGNTNDEGSREGGAVLRKARRASSVRSVIRVMV
jgi:hypothetical protein